MLKTAVLAPMPSARVSTETRVKPGLLRSERRAKRRSCSRPVMRALLARVARPAGGDGAAFGGDGGEIAEGLERGQPGRLRPHAGVHQLLRAHVEVEAQLAVDLAGDVGGAAGQAEEAAHGT